MKAKQFLVIGAGRFGSALAVTLYELGHEVVVIDSHEEAVEALMNEVTHAAILDATDEDALKKLGLDSFDQVIVAIGNNFEANILATVAAKNQGAKRVISKATSDIAAKVLAQVGADEVIRPEHDMGVRLAKQLATPSIVDAFNLGDDFEVIEFEAQNKLCGRLDQLKLTNRFGVQVVAVNRDGKLEASPGADFEIRSKDRVVLIGDGESIAELRNYLE